MAAVLALTTTKSVRFDVVKTPVIRNFFIEDSKGSSFLNSNELQWDGTWNQTMYAGNTYHLILEASDDNGWRDVDFFQVNLDKTADDMTVWYFHAIKPLGLTALHRHRARRGRRTDHAHDGQHSPHRSFDPISF